MILVPALGRVRLYHLGTNVYMQLFSRKQMAHKLKKMLGTPAGCPWDTRWDKQRSTGQCPRDFLVLATEGGCPRDTSPSRGFSEIWCDFFLCAFSAPYFFLGKLFFEMLAVTVLTCLSNYQRANKGPPNEDPPKSGLRVSVCSFSSLCPMKQY